jgi:hypothetical protein
MSRGNAPRTHQGPFLTRLAAGEGVWPFDGISAGELTMTIADYDKREKQCPVCKEERLIFITYAPKIRPEGKTVLYRCKDCAIAEADAANDPIALMSHPERSHLSGAWKRDHRAAPKVPINTQPAAKVTRAEGISDAVQDGGRQIPRTPQKSRPDADQEAAG